jgi:hypothetical protein
MKNEERTEAGLTVVGRLPEGYIVLCRQNGEEYSFLVKALGISVECPHCGATRCGPELAAENYLETANGNSATRMPAFTERIAAE